MTSYFPYLGFSIVKQVLSFSNEETKTITTSMSNPIVKVTAFDNIPLYYSVTGGTITVKTLAAYTGNVNLIAMEPR
jgi:hypothetical protein